MATIEVLVGMIASGKSTYAWRRAGEGALVVCHDDLTAMLHAEYRYEQGLRDCYRAMEEAIVREALLIGRDVVIDRTHLTRESRARWLGFARNVMLPIRTWEADPPRVIAVAFPIETPGVHATRRFKADSRGRTLMDWHDVAHHHWDQSRTEPLDESEGFAEIREERW